MAGLYLDAQHLLQTQSFSVVSHATRTAGIDDLMCFVTKSEPHRALSKCASAMQCGPRVDVREKYHDTIIESLFVLTMHFRKSIMLCFWIRSCHVTLLGLPAVSHDHSQSTVLLLTSS